MPVKARLLIVCCLVEGIGVRAAVRTADVSKNTVTKLMIDAGKACTTFQDPELRDLPCHRGCISDLLLKMISASFFGLRGCIVCSKGLHPTGADAVEAAERCVGMGKGVELRWAVAGRSRTSLPEQGIWDVSWRRIQVDEIWSFIDANEKNVVCAKSAHPEAGNVRTWAAICTDTKLVPSWRAGDRSGETAIEFLDDLRPRAGDSGAANQRRPQVVLGSR